MTRAQELNSSHEDDTCIGRHILEITELNIIEYILIARFFGKREKSFPVKLCGKIGRKAWNASKGQDCPSLVGIWSILYSVGRTQRLSPANN
jgi:hypothetical protein